MPNKKEVFSHVKNLEIQKFKIELNSQQIWRGEERGVQFKLARVKSFLNPIDSYILTDEEDATCLIAEIEGKKTDEVKKIRNKFVLALGKPLQSGSGNITEDPPSAKSRETIVWIEKNALENENRKPKKRLSSILKQTGKPMSPAEQKEWEGLLKNFS